MITKGGIFAYDNNFRTHVFYTYTNDTMTGSIEAKRDHIDLNVFIKKSPIFVLKIQFEFLST